MRRAGVPAALFHMLAGYLSAAGCPPTPPTHLSAAACHAAPRTCASARSKRAWARAARPVPIPATTRRPPACGTRVFKVIPPFGNKILQQPKLYASAMNPQPQLGAANTLAGLVEAVPCPSPVPCTAASPFARPAALHGALALGKTPPSTFPCIHTPSPFYAAAAPSFSYAHQPHLLTALHLLTHSLSLLFPPFPLFLPPFQPFPACTVSRPLPHTLQWPEGFMAVTAPNLAGCVAPHAYAVAPWQHECLLG